MRLWSWSRVPFKRASRPPSAGGPAFACPAGMTSGLDKSKSHTVPLDLRKLATLGPPHADRVGLLLVGLERADDPRDADVAELVGLAKLDARP